MSFTSGLYMNLDLTMSMSRLTREARCLDILEISLISLRSSICVDMFTLRYCGLVESNGLFGIRSMLFSLPSTEALVVNLEFFFLQRLKFCL